MIKLTIIGAGSAVFTKNIVVDLMHISQFKKMHISLMDIDKSRLKLAKELIDTVSNKLNVNPKVTLHTDRKEALSNASEELSDEEFQILKSKLTDNVKQYLTIDEEIKALNKAVRERRKRKTEFSAHLS